MHFAKNSAKADDKLILMENWDNIFTFEASNDSCYRPDYGQTGHGTDLPA